MIITANFTNNGIPQDGLAPSIRIINLPDLEVEVSGAAMTENTELTGSYFYDYTDYNPTGNYDIKCNAQTENTDFRFTYGINSENASGIKDISGLITNVKIKTDYLPADTSGEIAIIQGLLHSNIYTDPIWDGDVITGALIKLYDSKANTITHDAGGLLATFSMTGTYSAGKIETILMVRES